MDNAKAMIGWLLEELQRRDYMDIDGGDLQGALIKYGLLVEEAATEADCAEEWAQEYGVEVGDPVSRRTALAKECLKEMEHGDA